MVDDKSAEINWNFVEFKHHFHDYISSIREEDVEKELKNNSDYEIKRRSNLQKNVLEEKSPKNVERSENQESKPLSRLKEERKEKNNCHLEKNEEKTDSQKDVLTNLQCEHSLENVGISTLTDEVDQSGNKDLFRQESERQKEMKITEVDYHKFAPIVPQDSNRAIPTNDSIISNLTSYDTIKLKYSIISDENTSSNDSFTSNNTLTLKNTIASNNPITLKDTIPLSNSTTFSSNNVITFKDTNTSKDIVHHIDKLSRICSIKLKSIESILVKSGNDEEFLNCEKQQKRNEEGIPENIFVTESGTSLITNESNLNLDEKMNHQEINYLGKSVPESFGEMKEVEVTEKNQERGRFANLGKWTVREMPRSRNPIRSKTDDSEDEAIDNNESLVKKASDNCKTFESENKISSFPFPVCSAWDNDSSEIVQNNSESLLYTTAVERFEDEDNFLPKIVSITSGAFSLTFKDRDVDMTNKNAESLKDFDNIEMIDEEVEKVKSKKRKYPSYQNDSVVDYFENKIKEKDSKMNIESTPLLSAKRKFEVSALNNTTTTTIRKSPKCDTFFKTKKTTERLIENFNHKTGQKAMLILRKLDLSRIKRAASTRDLPKNAIYIENDFSSFGKSNKSIDCPQKTPSIHPFKCGLCHVTFEEASDLFGHAQSNHIVGISKSRLINNNIITKQQQPNKITTTTTTTKLITTTTKLIRNNILTKQEQEKSTTNQACLKLKNFSDLIDPGSIDRPEEVVATPINSKPEQVKRPVGRPRKLVLQNPNEIEQKKDKNSNVSFGKKFSAAIKKNLDSSSSTKFPFQCKKCNLSFKKEFKLKEHLRSNHNLTSSFDCRICETSFKTTSGMMSHLKKIHQPHSCKICKKRFSKKKLLNKHLMLKHPEKSRKRSEINQLRSEIATSDDQIINSPLNNNTRIDLSEKNPAKNLNPQTSDLEEEDERFSLTTFRCGTCSKSFTSRAAIESHVKSEHSKTAEEKNKNKNELLSINSSRKNSTIKCQFCSETSSNKTLNAIHVKAFHKAELRKMKNVKNTKKNCFPCEICGKEFAHKGFYEKHLRTVHKTTKKLKDVLKSAQNETQNETRNKTQTDKITPIVKLEPELEIVEVHPAMKSRKEKLKNIFRCKSCGKVFDNQGQVAKHMSSDHLNFESSENHKKVPDNSFKKIPYNSIDKVSNKSVKNFSDNSIDIKCEDMDMSKMKIVDPMAILQRGLDELDQTLKSSILNPRIGNFRAFPSFLENEGHSKGQVRTENVSSKRSYLPDATKQNKIVIEF